MSMHHQENPGMASSTLYERLGGWVPISLVVEKFCQRIFVDSQMRSLVQDTSLEDLQRYMVTVAMDLLGRGEWHEPGETINRLRGTIRLTKQQYERGVSHLIAAFVLIGFGREPIEAVLDRIEPLAEELVDSPDF